jgi:hypothetical protein
MMTEARKAQMRWLVGEGTPVQVEEALIDALAHIETLEEAARDHDCPSFAMCPRHATKEGANPDVCVYCEVERLEGENEEMAAWKARQQSACLGMAVELLDAGYKGDGITNGIKWLKAQLAVRDAEVAQHVEAYKSAHDQANKAEGEVVRLTEDYWKVNQSWAESRERHLTAEAALATLRLLLTEAKMDALGLPDTEAK